VAKQPPKNHPEWREAWAENRPADLRHGNPFIRILKKILRKPGDLFLATRLEQQRNFNLFLLDTFAGEEMQKQIETLARDTARLHEDIVRLQEHVQKSHGSLQSEVEKLRDGVVPALKEETEAVLGGIDAKAEWALARTRRFMSMAQEKALEKITPEAAADLDYAAFEDRFRGSVEAIEKDLAFYLDRIGEHYPVWDLGCGRGEFLRLLSREAIPSQGIEKNESFARSLKEEGLPVIHGDLFEVLSRAEPQSIGCVTLFHVLEHLPPGQASVLLNLIHTRLKPGGLLIVEVPNTGCLTGLFNFFKDPGHIHPWQQETLSHALNEAGFTGITILPRHPVPDSVRFHIPDNAPPALLDAFKRLNELVYGAQDIAAIGECAPGSTDPV